MTVDERYVVPTSTSGSDLPYDGTTRTSYISEHSTKVEEYGPSSCTEKDPEPEASHGDSNFPDGGWQAWLVVFGVSPNPLNLFSTFDLLTSSCVFSRHSATHFQRKCVKNILSSPQVRHFRLRVGVVSSIRHRDGVKSLYYHQHMNPGFLSSGGRLLRLSSEFTCLRP